MRTLVVGGVRSGKSRYAEAMINQYSHQKKYYIATAIAFDDEMTQRIHQHQMDRGREWITIEAPYDIVEIQFVPNSVALLECLTVYASNLQYKDKALFNSERIVKEILELSMKVKHLVVVSNDLFEGYYLNYSLETLEYLKVLSEVHKALAKEFDQVIEMKYSVPKEMK